MHGSSPRRATVVGHERGTGHNWTTSEVGILDDSHGLLAVPSPGPASQAHSLTVQAIGSLPHSWVSAAPSSLVIGYAGRTLVASIPFSWGWRHEGSTSCLSPLTLSSWGRARSPRWGWVCHQVLFPYSIRTWTLECSCPWLLLGCRNWRRRAVRK